MKLEGKQTLLRVYIGEQDRWGGVPLYEAVVEAARAQGMAGATVVKGFLGYGAKAHMDSAKLVYLSDDMPMVVEVVDTEEKVKALLPKLEGMVKDGLVTMEAVDAIVYRAEAATLCRTGQ